MSMNKYIQKIKKNNWEPFNKRLGQRSFHDHIIRINDKNGYYKWTQNIVSLR